MQVRTVVLRSTTTLLSEISTAPANYFAGTGGNREEGDGSSVRGGKDFLHIVRTISNEADTAESQNIKEKLSTSLLGR